MTEKINGFSPQAIMNPKFLHKSTKIEALKVFYIFWPVK